MISATFLFKQFASDPVFESLDQSIENFVTNHPEYLGRDQWSNQEKGILAVVYYFESEKGLEALKEFSDHKTAKLNHAQWYEGYQVIISQVIKSYGNGKLEHVTNRKL